MRRRAFGAASLAAVLTGCTALQPSPDTAVIPSSAAPTWQGDTIAILHAQWAWADPVRIETVIRPDFRG